MEKNADIPIGLLLWRIWLMEMCYREEWTASCVCGHPHIAHHAWTFNENPLIQFQKLLLTQDTTWL
jgi:hypothetical protein